MKTSTRLGAVLCISIAFFCVEIAIGFRTKSLALIADAFHYLNDIVAYVIAFMASHVKDKGYRPVGFTYALHRAELVGAFFNGVFLLALALSIFLQSLERFISIEVVEDPVSVMIVGCVGLTLNILSATIVHEHHGHGHGHSHGAAPQLPPTPAMETELEEGYLSGDESDEDDIHALHNHVRLPPPIDPHGNLGVLAVFIHVLGDAVNNVGVIIAAVLMWKLKSPHRFYADPAVSTLISLIIFASAIPLTLKSGRILLEASPAHLNLDHITEDLLMLEDVLSIHDLHIWQLSQSVTLASLHVGIPTGTSMAQWAKIEGRLRACMAAYGVSHVTMAPEVDDGTTLPGHDVGNGSGGSGGGKAMSCGDLLGCSALIVGPAGQPQRKDVEAA